MRIKVRMSTGTMIGVATLLTTVLLAPPRERCWTRPGR
jgi:hypothetical protein